MDNQTELQAVTNILSGMQIMAAAVLNTLDRAFKGVKDAEEAKEHVESIEHIEAFVFGSVLPVINRLTENYNEKKRELENEGC